MDTHEESRPRRITDRSSRDARDAVADVVERFAPWRHTLATMTAMAERGRLANAERTGIEKQCEELGASILEARTELLAQLIDAPTKVTAHSRVVDVERALDNIEAGLLHLNRLLERLQ